MATSVLGLKTFAASDPVDYNEVNDNYVKIDNGVKTALQGRAAHNLLDNSNFRNPVNQRGIANSATIERYTYFLDRWSTGGTAGTITLDSNGLIFNVLISQKIGSAILRTGTTVTAAAKFSDGTLVIVSGVVNISTSWNWFSSPVVEGCQIGLVDGTSDGIPYVRIGNEYGKTLVWAALYEGSYTADTLPAYQPKGYAAELAECQRYYQQYNIEEMSAVGSYENGNTYIRCQLSTPMRIAPSLVQSSVNMWATYNSVDSVTQAFIFYKASPQIVNLKCANSHGSSNQLVIATNNAVMGFSADL